MDFSILKWENDPFYENGQFQNEKIEKMDQFFPFFGIHLKMAIHFPHFPFSAFFYYCISFTKNGKWEIKNMQQLNKLIPPPQEVGLDAVGTKQKIGCLILWKLYRRRPQK